MNNEQIEKTIREYIEQIIHMSLATTVDGKPWVCEVHFSFDDELNLYFRSEMSRRHSQELEQNPHVAGNIVTQHFKNQKVRGVYFEGTAERLTEVTENDPAFTSVQKRYGNANIQAVAKDSKSGPSYYRISVSDWYLLDGYDAWPPEKHHLSWKK